MTQYLLSLYQPTGGEIEPERLEAIMRDVETLNDDIKAAGGWVFAAGLHGPESSTVLRAHDGEVVVTDGPYVEGKEFFGGFTLVQADDLDVALGWGRRLTAATGLPVEVRPVSRTF
jgi:hypothetical protein